MTVKTMRFKGEQKRKKEKRCSVLTLVALASSRFVRRVDESTKKAFECGLIPRDTSPL